MELLQRFLEGEFFFNASKIGFASSFKNSVSLKIQGLAGRNFHRNLLLIIQVLSARAESADVKLFNRQVMESVLSKGTSGIGKRSGDASLRNARKSLPSFFTQNR